MYRKTVVICCYGLFDPDVRTQEEMSGLEEYLEHCAKYITGLHSAGELSGIVLAGGYTNPQKSDLSEAGTNASHLITLLEMEGVSVEELNILLEDESYNTSQNLWLPALNVYLAGRGQAKYKGTRWNELSHNFIYICDNYRKFKVSTMLHYLREHFLNYRFSVESFPRQDIHPNSFYWKQFLSALAYLPILRGWMFGWKFETDRIYKKE